VRGEGRLGSRSESKDESVVGSNEMKSISPRMLIRTKNLSPSKSSRTKNLSPSKSSSNKHKQSPKLSHEDFVCSPILCVPHFQSDEDGGSCKGDSSFTESLIPPLLVPFLDFQKHEANKVNLSAETGPAQQQPQSPTRHDDSHNTAIVLSGSSDKDVRPEKVVSRKGSHYEFNAMNYLPVAARFNKIQPKVTPKPHFPAIQKDAITRTKGRKSSITPEMKKNTKQSITSSNNKTPRQNNTRRSTSSTRTSTTSKPKRRSPLAPGIKVAVPLFPYAAMKQQRRFLKKSSMSDTTIWPHQMATVVSCRRIHVAGFLSPQEGVRQDTALPHFERRRNRSGGESNCLSLHLQLDKCYLRNGTFAEMHIHVPDESRYMPRHSKYPIGSCVATGFGLGVLIGWRVEDDMHVVRSLWQKRGPGSACAYLHRSSLHGVVEAALGFSVKTKLGMGKVLAYVNGGRTFLGGRYFVLVTESGRHKGHVIEFLRGDVLSCPSAKFIPVIEHIREAAQFQIQFDTYKAELMREELHSAMSFKWSDEIEIVFAGLVKAVGENPDFDRDMNIVVTSIIEFLERLDIGQHFNPDGGGNESKEELDSMESVPDLDEVDSKEQNSLAVTDGEQTAAGLWFMNDLFGDIFKIKKDSSIIPTTISQNPSLPESPSDSTADDATSESKRRHETYNRIFSSLRTITRALAISRADATSRRPNLQLALSGLHEVLLFVTSVVKVRQKNVSVKAAEVRRHTWRQVKGTLIPIKNRMSRVGRGIVERLQRHGEKARARCARFIDIILHDDVMLMALEHSEWDTCIARLERAIGKAKILDRASCAQYRKSILFIYNALAPRAMSQSKDQSGSKIAGIAKALKWLSTPRRSILRLLSRDDVLEVLERILVRVYRNDSDACQTLNVYASSFHTFRHVLMLKNMSVTGKLWMPLLDAADEELAWAVSRMPEQTKEYLEPVSKLFSLGVASVRELMASESTGDWMDFLIKDEAVAIIQELDLKLVLNVEAFCNEVKETMVILPYYPSIDEDILNLLDEVDLRVELREAAEAIVDLDHFGKYVREKSALAIDRFLNYLPKMSIPIERRELGDGWVLTCRGKDGGDLALSDVAIEREKLVCQVMGSDNVLSSLRRSDDNHQQREPIRSPSSRKIKKKPSIHEIDDKASASVEVSILDDLRELLLNAEYHGCWGAGVGGIGQEPCPAAVAPALEGIQLSQVLACAIDLWRNLEIDDDELMEIAIRDVSYQIQAQKEREEDGHSGIASRESYMALEDHVYGIHSSSHLYASQSFATSVESFDEFDVMNHRRFNPRVDPTLLYLEMQGMTFHLDEFLFRVEQKERNALLDPVFEGRGSITIKNVSIRLRVECRKERIMKMDSEITVPVLQLQELDVRLDQVVFKFKDTGLDWILNKIVKGFSDSITEIVELNLKEQIISQIHNALEHVNAFVEVNPELMLGVLGITIDDLEENIVWV